MRVLRPHAVLGLPIAPSTTTQLMAGKSVTKNGAIPAECAAAAVGRLLSRAAQQPAFPLSAHKQPLMRGFLNSRIWRLVLGCDFNRSMQHLLSGYREEDIGNAATTEDLLHRGTEGRDVGSMAATGQEWRKEKVKSAFDPIR